MMFYDEPINESAYPLSDFFRMTHIGGATVLALIKQEYLDAAKINGEILILSVTGRRVTGELGIFSEP